MEKEKPFNCDMCGKRYKNLNGLKYVSHIVLELPQCTVLIRWQHKSHSLPCNPEFKAQAAAAGLDLSLIKDKTLNQERH